MICSRGGNKKGRSSSKLVRVLPLRNTMLFGYYVCTAEVGYLKSSCLGVRAPTRYLLPAGRGQLLQTLFVLSLQRLSLRSPLSYAELPRTI